MGAPRMANNEVVKVHNDEATFSFSVAYIIEEI
jgi:hypothetical protein